MTLLLTVIIAALCLILLLLLFQFRKLSDLSRKEADWAPIVNNLNAIQKGLEQVDRSVRDEMSRNRQETSAQSQLLRSEVVTALAGIGNRSQAKLKV